MGCVDRNLIQAFEHKQKAAQKLIWILDWYHQNVVVIQLKINFWEKYAANDNNINHRIWNVEYICSNFCY